MDVEPLLLLYGSQFPQPRRVLLRRSRVAATAGPCELQGTDRLCSDRTRLRRETTSCARLDLYRLDPDFLPAFIVFGEMRAVEHFHADDAARHARLWCVCLPGVTRSCLWPGTLSVSGALRVSLGGIGVFYERIELE